tara:strand:- start:232 stop:366 length:135 start_codon:yes stop_codon:yes gene_type:complete
MIKKIIKKKEHKRINDIINSLNTLELEITKLKKLGINIDVKFRN